MAKIFVSYCHQDEPWKERLVSHLGVLATEGLETWDDRRLAAGADWENGIREAIAECDVALLLISAHFLASEFTLREEVPLLLQRRRQGIPVIPVILSPCLWAEVPWATALQVWPRDGKPLAGRSDQEIEAVLSDLTAEIADMLLPRLAKPTEVPAVVSVFISYSHDSDTHRARVLALSERLRRDGISTDLDRYVNGTPPEGWPRWMLNRLERVDRVLLICTQTYYRRFRGLEEPGKGKGADWEGAVVTQAVYDARSRTARFIPVLFDRADESWIPEPLRGLSFYCLDGEAGYQGLYDALLDQSRVEPGPIGAPRRSRLRAASLTFAGETNTQLPGPRANGGLTVAPGRLSLAAGIWAEKLEFLRVQEAISSDPAQRFALKKMIEEAEARLRELS